MNLDGEVRMRDDGGGGEVRIECVTRNNKMKYNRRNFLTEILFLLLLLGVLDLTFFHNY